MSTRLLVGALLLIAAGCTHARPLPATEAATAPPTLTAAQLEGLNTPTVVTWTNGRKTVRFAEMMHVARPIFYQRVRDVVQAAGQEGYVLFYEGVAFEVLDDTGKRKVRKLLGMLPSAQNHAAGPLGDILRSLGGEPPVAQDNKMFFGLTGRPDVNLDMSGQEFLDVLEAEVGPVVLTLEDLETPLDKPVTPLPNMQQTLDNVVLRKRNQKIAAALVAQPGPGVVVLYGSAHRDTLLPTLRALDPTWREVAP